MALQKNYRHIPFNKGLDDKIDDLLAPDGYMDKLENITIQKDGELRVSPRFYEINDDINAAGDIKSLYSVVDDELFAFSERGVEIKRKDAQFEKISEKNFFDNDSYFVAREEEPVHNQSIAIFEGILLTAYQTKTGEDAQVNYHLTDTRTNTFLARGVITDAKDPIAFVTGERTGFLYKSREGNVLHFYDIYAKAHLRQVTTFGTTIVHTDTDTTDIIKTSHHEYLWVSKGWNSTTSQNILTVFRFDLNQSQLTSTEATVERQLVIDALGDTEDLGRVFGNHLSDISTTVEICITTKIGLASAEVEVYQYNLELDNFSFAFSVGVVNQLDNEIVGVFADTRDFRVIYFTDGADVLTTKVGDEEATRILDSFVLLDFFIIGQKSYYLVANRRGFFILDENYNFVVKFNNDHQNVFTDIRRIKVDVIGELAYLPTPRITSIEGFTDRGFSAYYNVLRIDRDQERECERFGQYYLITSSPLVFYDKQEVVEYGFSKTPNLGIDSADKI